MSSAHSTWRSHPFKTGRAYVALETFGEASGERFEADRAYVFENAAFSHYDGCSVFTFRDADSGERATWWLNDDASDEQFSRFSEIAPPGRSDSA
jgi:hypothetical protein